MALLPFPRLEIVAFRGLRDLALEECGPVNLLVGTNNCGKTSVLEALLLLSNPTDPRQWEGAVELRTTWPLADIRFRASIGRLDALTWLFPRHDGEIGTMELRGLGAVQHLRATAERISGEPPGRPMVSHAELIEGSIRQARLRGATAHEDPESFREPMIEPGLSIEMDFEWTNLEGPQGTLFDADSMPQHFRMLLWETGRRLQGYKQPFGPVSPVGFATPISHRSDGYLATRVSHIVRAKQKHRTIELLRKLDPRITGIEILTPDDPGSEGTIPRMGAAPALHLDYEGVGLVPVHAMGDGMRRALHLAALVTELDKGGALLLDEIEVGMHTSVLRDVFGWLCRSCREAGIQIFATTHSLEAVDAILEGVPAENLVLYRLHDGNARRFGGDLLHISRLELGQEVR